MSNSSSQKTSQQWAEIYSKSVKILEDFSELECKNKQHKLGLAIVLDILNTVQSWTPYLVLQHALIRLNELGLEEFTDEWLQSVGLEGMKFKIEKGFSENGQKSNGIQRTDSISPLV